MGGGIFSRLIPILFGRGYVVGGVLKLTPWYLQSSLCLVLGVMPLEGQRFFLSGAIIRTDIGELAGSWPELHLGAQRLQPLPDTGEARWANCGGLQPGHPPAQLSESSIWGTSQTKIGCTQAPLGASRKKWGFKLFSYIIRLINRAI